MNEYPRTIIHTDTENDVTIEQDPITGQLFRVDHRDGCVIEDKDGNEVLHYAEKELPRYDASLQPCN